MDVEDRRVVHVESTRLVVDRRTGTGLDGATNLAEFVDVALTRRGDQWVGYGIGADMEASQRAGRPVLDLYEARLPPGASLRAAGWQFTTAPDDADRAVPVARRAALGAWDDRGQRHCPTHVVGPGGEERLYYAGASEQVWGPYGIGALTWRDGLWEPVASPPGSDPAPVMTADQPWEYADGAHGGVYEPSVLWHDGSWRMWYVTGSQTSPDGLRLGYAESEDGLTGWRKSLFAAEGEGWFDFAVRASPRGGFDAVASSMAHGRRRLVWYSAAEPYRTLREWGEGTTIVRAGDDPWNEYGTWHPALAHDEDDPQRVLVFFDAAYEDGDIPSGVMPTFTLGCVECRLG